MCSSVCLSVSLDTEVAFFLYILDGCLYLMELLYEKPFPEHTQQISQVMHQP